MCLPRSFKKAKIARVHNSTANVEEAKIKCSAAMLTRTRTSDIEEGTVTLYNFSCNWQSVILRDVFSKECLISEEDMSKM